MKTICQRHKKNSGRNHFVQFSLGIPFVVAGDAVVAGKFIVPVGILLLVVLVYSFLLQIRKKGVMEILFSVQNDRNSDDNDHDEPDSTST